VREAIRNGIAKVNIGATVRQTYAVTLEEAPTVVST